MLAGSLDEWLPSFRNLEERVADAVEAAWPGCVAPLQSKKNVLENEITKHLVNSLIRAKKVNKVPGRFSYQHALLAEDVGGNVSAPSNIDFVLIIGDDEDVYLACECKRLNVPYGKRVRALSGEYVDEGLMRFVTGQYSRGLPLAMMLGYVMDAQTVAAKNSVAQTLKKRSSAIGLQSADYPNVVSGRPVRFFTTHTCASSGSAIEVTHTLLAWP
jgi:hypothetical protein